MLAVRACERSSHGELLFEAGEEVFPFVLGMESDSTQQAAQPSAVMMEGTQVSLEFVWLGCLSVH